ncbi:MAG: ferredoxin family protein [Bacillota bacterium]
MAAKGKLTIDREKCKGCGLCVEFCPRGILELDKKINIQGYNPAIITDEDNCNACGFCFLVCPDVVIEVERVKEGSK